MLQRRRRTPLAALAAAGLLLAACGRAASAPVSASRATVGGAVAASPAATATAAAPSTALASASATASATSSASPAAPPASWAALGTFTPRSIQANRGRVAADPADPDVLAVCVPGAVRVSRDGGSSWTSIDASGVAAALPPTGYALGQADPACVTALADGGSVYAVYAAGKAQYGMPPVYYVAVDTADGGRTWRAVPAPKGFDAGDFGGLAVTASGAVQAIFGGPQASFALIATRDGGASWQAASLDCPGGGVPCLRWGPAPSGTGSCAMHDYPQPIERSADGGQSWTAAYDPARADLANGCDLNELVGISATRALLVGRDVDAQASVRVSDDGGRTWTAVKLPPLPPGTNPAPGGVQMLPDGALIAVVSGQASPLPVDLLVPGATAWCTVPGLTVSGTYTDPGTVQPAGSRLIWLQQASDGGTPTLTGVPLSAVHC